MSEAIFTDFDQFSLEGDRDTSGGDKKIVILKIVVLVLCLLLLIEAVLYTFVIPCLAPVKIECKGLSSLTENDLIQELGDMQNSTWINFDTAKAVSILSSISAIDTVSVDKHFPDHVTVVVRERIPVAKTIIMVNGRSTPVQIDENGVLFTTKAYSNFSDSSIPLVTGLPVDNVKDGMRLNSKYRALMEQVATIRALPQKYFAAISEIQVVPKEYGNYELVLYPIHTRVRVLTDRTLNEDALKYMMVVLDVVNSIEPDVGEIDLRYGSVSYRKR